MAVKISDSKSFGLEPIRKNRWVFEFSAIPGSDSSLTDELAFVAHTCSAPHLTFADQTINRMNEVFKYAGNPTWADIQCNFYDFIRNSNAGANVKSAADILNDWSSLIYNGMTGQMGYKTQYATSATLAQLDPAGSVIRAWNLFGIFPSDIDFGSGLDYSQGEACDIAVTFKYDLAIKVADATSSSESK